MTGSHDLLLTETSGSCLLQRHSHDASDKALKHRGLGSSFCSMALQGFPARLRTAEEGLAGDADAQDQRRRDALARSVADLAVAWSLAAICCFHHAGHLFHAMGLHSIAHSPALAALHSVPMSAGLGAFALLGPGRQVISDGAQSLVRCAYSWPQAVMAFWPSMMLWLLWLYGLTGRILDAVGLQSRPTIPCSGCILFWPHVKLAWHYEIWEYC